jgi:hypothetical protein
MALVSVMAMCDSPTDTEARYFGISVDEPLAKDFWVSQPQNTVGLYRQSVSFGRTYSLPAGTHYFEINTSAPSDAGWYAKVYVGQIKDSKVSDEEVAEGRLGNDLPNLRISVTVKEEVVEGKTVETVSSAPAGGTAVAPPAAPPKPWYLHHEPYLIAGGVIALIAGAWYLSRRGVRYGSS